MSDTPLDASLRELVIAMRDKVERDARHLAPVRILINRTAIKAKGTSPLRELATDLIGPLCADLRDTMPAVAWPVTIQIGPSFQGDLVVDRLGVAGIAFGGLENVDRSGIIRDEYVAWRSKSMFGLDGMARDMDLISRMTPPSNRPIQSWSMANNLMGTPHVSHEGLHARSEAEALLKLEWMRGGRAALEAILSAGRIEPRRNDDRQWFVASELEDLDLDPEGRLPFKDDAARDIARHLEALSQDLPEP